MLCLEHITKTFAGFRAVDDCSLRIERGSMTGLIGPNGAGKTTLLNIMAGFLQPTAGRILLADRDITGVSAHRLFHQGLVRTFQIPQPLGSMTVLENLMLVPPTQLGETLWSTWFRWSSVLQQEKVLRQQAEETLDCLNLSHLRDERAQNISGGQKKLLELGRALMAKPKLILLDEPAAGVNRTLLKQLTQVIRQLNAEHNCTICVIEHDLAWLEQLCDRIIVLAQGQVLAQGSMAEIRQHPQVQAIYLGHQPQSSHDDVED